MIGPGRAGVPARADVLDCPMFLPRGVGGWLGSERARQGLAEPESLPVFKDQPKLSYEELREW